MGVPRWTCGLWRNLGRSRYQFFIELNISPYIFKNHILCPTHLIVFHDMNIIQAQRELLEEVGLKAHSLRPFALWESWYEVSMKI
jgi:hypothetical protein